MGFITLRLYYAENLNDTDFTLRHIIADTIEQRDWAKIIEEGTGDGYFDIILFLKKRKKKKAIMDLIKSLGFSRYEILEQ